MRRIFAVLEDHKWYVDGSPLVRLVAETLYSARLNDVSEDSYLWCFDSNGGINVLDFVKQIEQLK